MTIITVFGKVWMYHRHIYNYDNENVSFGSPEVHNFVG